MAVRISRTVDHSGTHSLQKEAHLEAVWQPGEDRVGTSMISVVLDRTPGDGEIGLTIRTYVPTEHPDKLSETVISSTIPIADFVLMVRGVDILS